MKNIEQNKNTPVMFKLAFFVLLLCFSVCCFCYFDTPVSADQTNSISLSDQRIPVVSDLSASSVVSAGFQFSYANDGSTPNYFASTLPNTYFFHKDGGEGSLCYAFCPSDPSVPYCAVAQGNIAYTLSSLVSVLVDDVSHDLYYIWSQAPGFSISASSLSSFIPCYSADTPIEDIVSEIVGHSVSGSCLELTTSYQTVSTSMYFKASINFSSALALFDDNGSTRVVVGSYDQNCFIYQANDTAYDNIPLVESAVVGDYLLYYGLDGVISNDALNLGSYSSLSDAVNALGNYLIYVNADAGNVPRPHAPLNISLPAGNVIFIDVRGYEDPLGLTVKATSNTSISVDEANSGAFNVVYGVVGAIIQNVSFPNRFINSVPDWTMTGKPTVFGTSQNFIFSNLRFDAQGGNYIAIYNPTYSPVSLGVNGVGNTSDNPSATNFPVDIYVSQCNGYYIAPIEMTISYDGNTASWTTESQSQAGAGIQGTFDPNTQGFVSKDSSGEPAEPQVGGLNNIPTNSVADEARNFGEWLKNFLRNFVSIFDAGKSAIMTLVGYGQSFFSVIGALYQWLPAPVYAVLTSAIVLVITIGIIKVFI